MKLRAAEWRETDGTYARDCWELQWSDDGVQWHPVPVVRLPDVKVDKLSDRLESD